MLEGLAGKRLLVLDGDSFLDDATRRILEAAGAYVQVARITHADRLLSQGSFDAAIIDLKVAVDVAFFLSERLDLAGIPFLFALDARNVGTPGRFIPYRLCTDIDELKAIRDGLFGSAQAH